MGCMLYLPEMAFRKFRDRWCFACRDWLDEKRKERDKLKQQKQDYKEKGKEWIKWYKYHGVL